MLLSAILPTVLSVGSFILTLVLIVSGRDNSIRSKVFILKINTDHITPQTDTFSTSKNSSAHDLGLYDFYTAHVMTWCEVREAGDDTPERITRCTDPRIPFTFNPIKIIDSELPQNTTLESLGLTQAKWVSDVSQGLSVGFQAMSTLYLISVLLIGPLSLMCAMALFFGATRILALIGVSIAAACLVALGLASAISTVIGIQVRDAINENGSVINISAECGPTFLLISWAAVFCIVVVLIYWTARCCYTSGRKSSYDDEKVALKNRESKC